jgi:hypothetical protein
MAVYVQLHQKVHIDVAGKLTAFYPGDWVQVGRQTAELWIATGVAWQPSSEIVAPYGAGIWVTGLMIPDCAILKVLPHTEGGNILPYPRTFVWQPELGFRSELLGTGFKLLTKWQMAAPIKSYTQLARDIGNLEDREKTEAVIHDLRVPVYDSRAFFVRRCARTNELISLWREEDGDSDLALMRAIYKIKPTICALPTTWTNRGIK